MRCLFVFDFVYAVFPLGREAHGSANGVSILSKTVDFSVTCLLKYMKSL